VPRCLAAFYTGNGHLSTFVTHAPAIWAALTGQPPVSSSVRHRKQNAPRDPAGTVRPERPRANIE